MTERFEWGHDSIPIDVAIEVLQSIERDHPHARVAPTEGGSGSEITVAHGMYGTTVRIRTRRPA